jgi:hypothetical protein
VISCCDDGTVLLVDAADRAHANINLESSSEAGACSATNSVNVALSISCLFKRIGVQHNRETSNLSFIISPPPAATDKKNSLVILGVDVRGNFHLLPQRTIPSPTLYTSHGSKDRLCSNALEARNRKRNGNGNREDEPKRSHCLDLYKGSKALSILNSASEYLLEFGSEIYAGENFCLFEFTLNQTVESLNSSDSAIFSAKSCVLDGDVEIYYFEGWELTFLTRLSTFTLQKFDISCIDGAIHRRRLGFCHAMHDSSDSSGLKQVNSTKNPCLL